MQQDAAELAMNERVRRGVIAQIQHLEPSRKRLYQYTFFALIVSVASNIPIFFEFKYDQNIETRQKIVNVTALRMNENYIMFYKNAFEGVGMMAVPFVAMACMNASIIHKLYQRRLGIMANGCRQIPLRTSSNETNLAKIIVVMDVVFLSCHLGRVGVNIWEMLNIGDMKECMTIGLGYKVIRRGF